MIKIITDKKEKDTLTKMYFHGITARALEEFSKKSGYGDDFLGIHFKEYLEDDPYETIRQLTAVKGAVSGMISSYIEHYAKGHMIESIRNASTSEAEAQIDNLLEIIKVYGK